MRFMVLFMSCEACILKLNQSETKIILRPLLYSGSRLKSGRTSRLLYEEAAKEYRYIRGFGILGTNVLLMMGSNREVNIPLYFT